MAEAYPQPIHSPNLCIDGLVPILLGSNNLRQVSGVYIVSRDWAARQGIHACTGSLAPLVGSGAPVLALFESIRERLQFGSSIDPLLACSCQPNSTVPDLSVRRFKAVIFANLAPAPYSSSNLDRSACHARPKQLGQPLRKTPDLDSEETLGRERRGQHPIPPPDFPWAAAPLQLPDVNTCDHRQESHATIP